MRRLRKGHKSITIWEKKRKKKRLITFSPSVLKIVNQLEGDDDDYVFASRQGGGKPITRVQAYRILNDAAKRAGIYSRIRSHDSGYTGSGAYYRKRI